MYNTGHKVSISGMDEKVLSQGIHTCNLKALFLFDQKYVLGVLVFLSWIKRQGHELERFDTVHTSWITVLNPIDRLKLHVFCNGKKRFTHNMNIGQKRTPKKLLRRRSQKCERFTTTDRQRLQLR